MDVQIMRGEGGGWDQKRWPREEHRETFKGWKQKEQLAVVTEKAMLGEEELGEKEREVDSEAISWAK